MTTMNTACRSFAGANFTAGGAAPLHLGKPGTEIGNFGGGRVDCIGRWESGRAHREIASQFRGLRITPNVYTTLAELDRFCEQIELIGRKDLPA